ncbi:S-layer homology domain-containing protein [Paenibacillus chitinolyticus]
MKVKWISLSLSAMLLTGMGAQSVQVAAAVNNEKNTTVTSPKLPASFTDLQGHWAKDVVQTWQQRGVVNGEGEVFDPNRQISRAEWSALINRIFQYEKEARNSFIDVKPEEWFASDIQKGVAAGYVSGFEDGTFRPDAPLSRQEAAVTLSRILHLKENSVVTFTDQEQLPAWSRAYVGAAVDARLIDGYQDGSFGPLNALTRAEAVQLLDRTFGYYGQWYGESGTYGSEQTIEQKKGSVVINSPGVTLQNMEIAGDLIISKQVGDGDVYLKNVKVQGRTLIYGGGENSVHMEDSVLLTVIVNKKTGAVRLVAEGKTTIQEVTIQSASNVVSKLGANINHVTLAKELPEKSRVHLNGSFNSVDIDAKSIFVQVPSGTINNLTTDSTAEGISLELSHEAKILEAVLNAAATVLGEGNVGKVTVNTKGVSFAQAPEKVELGSGVPADTTIKIGQTDMPVTGEKTNPVPSNGSSQNNDSGSSNTDQSGGGSSGGGSSPGGGGDGTNNNGNIPPLFDNGKWFSIALENEAVTVGESVYVYSPRKGTAYLAPASIDTTNRTMLEEAVNTGIAKKVQISPNTRTEISTQGFHTNGYITESKKVVVLDEQNTASFWVILTLLDGSDVDLKLYGLGMSGGSASDQNETFHFSFNRKVQLIPGNDIYDFIQLSIDSETPNFKSLKDNDLVKIEVKDHRILMKATKDLGKSVYFRLLPGAVETVDGTYKNTEYSSVKMSSTIRLYLLEGDTTLKVGTKVKFKVSREADVYFVYKNNVPLTKDQYDKEVSDGHGLHILVPEDGINTIYEFDTKDLQPGDYQMMSLYSGIGYFITLKK